MQEKGALHEAPKRKTRHQNPAKQAKAACAQHTKPFIYQLILLAVYRCGAALSLPFSSMLATYKTFHLLADFVSQIISHSLGWLGQPMFTPRFGRGDRMMSSWSPFSPFPTAVAPFHILRVIKRWHFLAAAVVALSLINKIYRRIMDAFDERVRRKNELKNQMDQASSYQHWQQLAKQLEALESQVPLPQGPRQSHFDEALLKEKVEALKRAASSCGTEGTNPRDLMFALRMDLARNIANIAKNGLNEQSPAIPGPVHEYIQAVRSMLHQIRDWPASQLPYAEKLSFFRETRHTFGRTALLLSGGGSLGTFHMGVCKALFAAHLLPKVLAGSSAGSIVCAIIATRTDIELRDMFSRIHQFDMNFFTNSSGVELVKHLINKGSLQDISFMIKRLRALLGELTFLEAFERTGRILNVTVCPADEKEPPKLLNYLTSPHALVWSAVAASSAFPGLYPAQHLLARSPTTGEIVTFSAHSGDGGLDRKWRDGSLEMDLPAQALGEMFNCNHYIVSQTNPHIVPLLNIKKSLGDGSKIGNILEAELKHRCQVLQWILPQWIPSKW